MRQLLSFGGSAIAVFIAASLGNFCGGPTAPCTLVLAPAAPSLAPGGTQFFRAYVENPSDGGVVGGAIDPRLLTWHVTEGQVDPQTGLYIAPLTSTLATVSASLGDRCTAAAVVSVGTVDCNGGDGGSCPPGQPISETLHAALPGTTASANGAIPVASGIPSASCGGAVGDGGIGHGAPIAFPLDATATSILAIQAEVGPGGCGAGDGGCNVQVSVRTSTTDANAIVACAAGSSVAALQLSGLPPISSGTDGGTPGPTDGGTTPPGGGVLYYLVVDAFNATGSAAQGMPFHVTVTNLATCSASSQCGRSHTCQANVCCSNAGVACAADAECCSGRCAGFQCAR
jgi:hypothetical protein